MYSAVEQQNYLLKNPKYGEGGKGRWVILAIVFVAALSLGLLSGYAFGGNRVEKIVIVEEEQPTEPEKSDVGGAEHYAGGGQGSKFEHGRVGPQEAFSEHGRQEGPNKGAEYGRQGGQKGGQGGREGAAGKPREKAPPAGVSEIHAEKDIKAAEALKAEARGELKKAQEHDESAAATREKTASKLLKAAEDEKKLATHDEKRVVELAPSPPRQAAGRGAHKGGAGAKTGAPSAGGKQSSAAGKQHGKSK